MRVIWVTLTFTVVLVVAAAAQETPRGGDDESATPKDAVKVVVIGCVKDKLLRASDIETLEDESVPPITRTVFRLSGKKRLTEPLKRLEQHQMAVTGYIRKVDLKEPGIRVGGGRVVLGAPSMDPRRPPLPDTGDRPVVLEVIGFEERPGGC